MKSSRLPAVLGRGIPSRAGEVRTTRAPLLAAGDERGFARRHSRRGDSPRRRRAAACRRQGVRHSLPELQNGGVGHGPTTGMSQVHGRARSGGQVGATLAAAPRNHGFSAALAHPHAEAVRLLALAVVGLKRPLHAWPPRIARAEVGAPGRARNRFPKGGCNRCERAQADVTVYAAFEGPTNQSGPRRGPYQHRCGSFVAMSTAR